MTTQSPVNYYDARLIAVSDTGAMGLDYMGRSLELLTFTPTSDYLRNQVGQIGVVMYASEGQCWRFNAYLDQTLRRMPELDSATDLGWHNEARKDVSPNGWTAPRGIVPGMQGAFVEIDTDPVTIDVPAEFFDLCDGYGLTVEAVLRGFIADACGLMNYVREPRGDGYNSNGSDERMMAQDYLDRAHIWRNAA